MQMQTIVAAPLIVALLAFTGVASAEANAASVRAALTKTIIPEISFRKTTAREAIDFLRKASEVYSTEKDPQQRGVTLVLQLPPDQGRTPSISFRAKNISLQHALKAITSAANLQYSIRSGWILIEPRKD